MAFTKLVFFATFWLVVVPSYIPFETSYNVTSLSLNIFVPAREVCAACSGLGPAYANLDNLPPYTDTSFNFIEYPSGVCDGNMTCNWIPTSSTTFSWECTSNYCAPGYSGNAYFPEQLPAVVFDNSNFQVTVVQLNRCPGDTFYCGTACCAVGTACSNPTTGQCCAGVVNTC